MPEHVKLRRRRLVTAVPLGKQLWTLFNKLYMSFLSEGPNFLATFFKDSTSVDSSGFQFTQSCISDISYCKNIKVSHEIQLRGPKSPDASLKHEICIQGCQMIEAQHGGDRKHVRSVGLR